MYIINSRVKKGTMQKAILIKWVLVVSPVQTDKRFKWMYSYVYMNVNINTYLSFPIHLFYYFNIFLNYKEN